MQSHPLHQDLLRRLRPFRTIVPVLGLTLFGASAGEAASSAQRPDGPVEIVLDGSDAMRGRLGEVRKIDAARDFIDRLRVELSDGDDPPALGLRVFGAGSARPQRDCRDSRILLSPADPAEAWPRALSEIEPLGGSALARALGAAAGDEATTFVLVTGGADGCGDDACETWREIARRGGNRRLRLHVVAFDPDSGEVEGLRCLSRAGSGTFLRIDGASEVVDAARRLARILRNEGLLDVRLSVGGERFAAPVRVLRPVDEEIVDAFTARGPRPLPAGMYTVVVETAPTVVFDRVLVLPGETAVIGRDDYGRIEVSLLDEGNRPLMAPVSIRASGGGPELRYATTGEAVVLGEGAYDVVVDLGDSLLARAGVQVAAGRTARVSFGGTGAVRIVAPEFSEPPLTRALLMRGGRIDTLSVGSWDTLPAGRYRLVVHTIPVYVSQGIVVEAAGKTSVELPATGVLGVDLSGPDGPLNGVRIDVREPLTGEIYGAVASGERRLVMPGTYHLEMSTVPPRVEEGIEVIPGKRRVVTRGGMGRIAVEASTDPPDRALRLEVLADGGARRLGEATGAPPAIHVWPGSYLVRVWRGARLSWEGPVSVAPDETARIDSIGSLRRGGERVPAGDPSTSEGRRP